MHWKMFFVASLIRETSALPKTSLILCCSRLLELNIKPRRKRTVQHMATYANRSYCKIGPWPNQHVGIQGKEKAESKQLQDKPH